MSKSTRAGPQFVRLFGPVIDALNQLGGSGRPAEVNSVVIENLKIPDADLTETISSGGSRFSNRVGWARFYLAKAGYIDDSVRGVWSLTEKGRGVVISPTQALEIFHAVRARFGGPEGDNHDAKPGPSGRNPEPIAPTPEELGHRQALMAVIQSLPPSGFERLCQRLLRESDFESVTVTGRSGDGGIDGIGVLQVNPFVSFKVLFQCKRYSGSVSASQIRDFRGAMMGRTDKGLVLTTGAFTMDAKREAIRDGVPPIELVDGEKLLDMFERLELGLKPKKAYDVDIAFFNEFQN